MARRGRISSAETGSGAGGAGAATGDWKSYALAFSGPGQPVHAARQLSRARRFHVRALRAARRHSLRAIQGSAQHDLFVLAAGSNHKDEAERYARGAFESYGPEHPRLPALANDLAYVWMERGHFAPALTVFEALLPHMQRQEDRLVCLGNIVRAAAGAGERRLFEQMWDEVWDGLSRDEGTGRPRRSAGCPTSPRSSARRSGRSARRAGGDDARDRGEAKTCSTSEAVLDSVRRGRAARARAAEAPLRAPNTETSRRPGALADASLVARYPGSRAA